MTDRALLELAAKAAGIELGEGSPWRTYSDASGFDWINDSGYRIEKKWNPLHNDGDALRLAVMLRLSIGHDMNFPSGPISWVRLTGEFGGKYQAAEAHGIDPDAAARRAIVRAAAELGTQGVNHA